MYPAPAFRQRGMLLAAMRQLIAVVSGVFILFFSIKIFPHLPACPAFSHVFKIASDWTENFYEWDAIRIMEIGMPVLNRSDFEGDTGDLTAWQIILDGVGAVSRANLRNPAGVMQSEIPLLARLETPAVKVTAVPAQPPGTAAVLSDDCLVAIYNTHTGETYSLTDGVERLDGRKGGVVTVAAALQEELESKYGIKTARSERINDADYNTSYLESEKTARELLAANPKTMVILDIHRDSGKTREQSIVNINGQEVATLLFIVGSDARRSFPNWRQNHAFAQELSDKINSMYPGLSLGVRVKDGIYNQSLHPQALLVEVGTTKNSTEEAARSVRLMAAALAAIIRQQ
ncbi:Stage II sporulation protein P (SpoIIP) [Pelotomaculum sp. FP]|uniref:stage II sporulation protein P n=1 Tax=Pelotomaculum sp. FP TaxID=261474 RepID=UPI001064D1F5|nr:stage II sporulation protein P [Pelotomaculum sp. FP]TEB14903.1 Stage II sporulation protein P (SpoIIP) [Pelotomaculum sp. FP]